MRTGASLLMMDSKPLCDLGDTSGAAACRRVTSFDVWEVKWRERGDFERGVFIFFPPSMLNLLLSS